MNAKKIAIAAGFLFMFVYSYALAPIYIDWLDGIFGLWSIWSCLTFALTTTVVIVALAYFVALLAVQVR
jgi:hypothetical protein